MSESFDETDIYFFFYIYFVIITAAGIKITDIIQSSLLRIERNLCCGYTRLLDEGFPK